MALDPDTQYFQLPTSDVGITPALDPFAGQLAALPQDPTIAALAKSLKVSYDQAAQMAQAKPAPPAAGQPMVPMAGGAPASLPAPGPAPLPAPGQPMVPMAGDAQGQGMIPAPGPMLDTHGSRGATPLAAAAMPPGALPVQSPRAMQGNTSPAPGQLPHHDNRIIQALGVISALMNGPGGNIASQYIQQQHQTDLENQARQTQQGQQQFNNQTAQSEAGQSFIQHLAALDNASQESVVGNLTPAQMMATGFTPAQVKAQFYNADGTFKPVGSADKPETVGQQAQLQRAQTAARARLTDIPLAGQQKLHDGFTPENWEQTYGTDYASFVPSNTVKEAQGDAKLGQGGRRLDQQQSAIQQIAYTQLRHMALPVQGQMWKSYAMHPELFEAKYGTPYDGFVPGETDANSLAGQGIANREKDAVRSDRTRTLLSEANIASRFKIDTDNNAVAMRGQDLRRQQSQLEINQRSLQFSIKYGKNNSASMEKEWSGIAKQRLSLMKEMTRLSANGKDQNGDPTLSIRDQGRIGPDGNLVANPEPTAGYIEYMQLQSFDQQLAARQQSLTAPDPYAPAGAPAGMNLPPPGPYIIPDVGAAVSGRATPRAGLGPVGPLPPFDPMQPGAAYTSHGGFTPSALPPALQRAFAGQRGRSSVQGSYKGQSFSFASPTSSKELAALTPLKRHAYVAAMRKQGKLR